MRGWRMTQQNFQLVMLPDLFAICRLDSDAPAPAWATSRAFISMTRTADELSIVCPQGQVPDGVQCVRDWRCLRIADKLDLSMIGVLASLVTPLAEAGISIFSVSTFDTDYLLVRDSDLEKALAALRAEERGGQITLQKPRAVPPS